MAKTVKPAQKQTVGVADFKARCLELHAVQLHGHETADYARALRAALPGIAIWQARPVSDSLPEPAADADLTLLDAAHPSLRGGTGRRFDWSLLRDAGEAARFVLAGGIDPATAARADALGCHALDICSGVESAPGVKDPVRLEALFAALRAASGQAA